MVTLKDKVINLYRFWKRIWSREIAAGLTFYFVTGFMPVLCLLVLMCGHIFSIDSIVGGSGFKILFDFIKSMNAVAENRVLSGGVIFVITTVYSVTNLFYRFQRCGEILYKYKPKHKSVIKRLISFLFVGITVVLSVITAFVFFLINLIFEGILYVIISAVFAAVFLFILLLVINKLVCPHKIPLSFFVRGSIITIILWIAVTAVFIIYVKYFASYEKTYGIFAGIFCFLFYIYFLMQGFTFGISFNILRLGKVKIYSKT